MHISEGILPTTILATGGLIALTGTIIGLMRMEQEQVPRVGIMTAAFFVASLIHVPIGPSSIHLVLNGLVGILLGWACFPAILVALLLQALFFQFGGISVLGVNTVIMALPALMFYFLCRPLINSKTGYLLGIGSFISGFGAVLGAGILVAVCLALAGKSFFPAAKVILIAHIPIMIIEGIITLFIIQFLRKVKPEMINPSIT
ncbi:MAG TPA: cobalt transporter CbiM [Desulfohalobiaceae bacterium]|nr:cobalt transporter CbiM [Desulfohalobiaceae bacterium]